MGDVVVRSYTPARAGQRTTIIHVYCSDRPDPAFVTDAGVRRCGTLCLDLTDTLYQHQSDLVTSPDHQASTPDTAPSAAGESGWSAGGRAGWSNTRRGSRRREIRTRMTFGDTEIRVDAVDLTTGRCVRAGIDFLNK